MKTKLYLFDDGTQFKCMGDDNRQSEFESDHVALKYPVQLTGVLDITDRLVLNLGLENNPFDAEQCIELVSEFGTVENHFIDVGEWEGKPERTLVVAISNVDLWSWELVADVRKLAVKTTQQAIALKYNGAGAVVNQTAPDTIIFDEQYFIDERSN